MQTEFEFTLPRGFRDQSGMVHKNGRIRLATALDEIEAIQHPRVQQNEAYLPIAILGRVVTQLGTLPQVSGQLLEQLFAADLSYLQDLYLRLNGHERMHIGTVCPHCSQTFQVQVMPLG